MLIQTPPTSSTERVRQFRQRNPGYDRRYMARQRAKLNEAFARLQAEALAAAQVVAPAEPLMLPAPVADPMMAQLNGLAALRESQSAAELVPVAVVENAERLRRAVRM
jgi:hypothetical protein